MGRGYGPPWVTTWHAEALEIYWYAKLDHHVLWDKLMTIKDKRAWEELDLWIQHCNMLVRTWILDNQDILSRS